MTTFHRVFTDKGLHVTDVPWQDDDNGGLPQWYFDGEFVAMEIDLTKDKVEWTPAIGPAPCWEAKFSDFASNKELFAAFRKWVEITY